MQFKLFSLRRLSNAALTDSMKNTPKTHISLAGNRVLGGKHSEPLVNQYVWNSLEMWCYCFLSVFWDQQLAYPEFYPRGKFTFNTLLSMWRSDFTHTVDKGGSKRKFYFKIHSQVISLHCLNVSLAKITIFHCSPVGSPSGWQLTARSTKLLNFWFWT